MLEALARVNAQTGMHETAALQLRRAKAIYLSHTAPGVFCLGAVRACRGIGELQWSQGMYKDALETFVDGVDMCTGVIDSHSGYPARPMNHQGVTMGAAEALMERGGLLLRLGRYAEVRHREPWRWFHSWHTWCKYEISRIFQRRMSGIFQTFSCSKVPEGFRRSEAVTWSRELCMIEGSVLALKPGGVGSG